jgi:Cu2+-exporting ATPase
MLTGDNEATASSIAMETGVDQYQANTLPQDKYDFITELQRHGKTVAMVGDGINDSQALAQANVSIAMGKGSDIAIDVAKMTIISSDLTKNSTGHYTFTNNCRNDKTESFLGIHL